MQLTEGTVRINGSVAYGAQQAWIMNATVKENILLGQPYNEARYSSFDSSDWIFCVLNVLKRK